MATDETAFPGAVFRMQHCYVHDGNGGNNVKTRAERNEIYYNWIEGAAYRAVELSGPAGPSAASPPPPPATSSESPRRNMQSGAAARGPARRSAVIASSRTPSCLAADP